MDEPSSVRSPSLGWDALPIVELDTAARVSGWSRGAERLLGYRSDAVRGKPLSIFYPPEDLRGDAPERELREAAAAGHAQAEGWWTRRDGERVWVLRFLWPARAGRGTASGTTLLLCDLTERRHAERRLFDRERCYAELVEQTPDPVFLLDRTGRIAETNPAAERVRGGDARSLTALVSDAERPDAGLAFEEALHGRVGTARLVLGGAGARAPFRVTFLPVRVDGAVAAVFAVAAPQHPVEGEGGGGASGRFRALVEAARDVFFFEADAAGRLAYLSPSARAIAGRAPSEMLGRTFPDLVGDLAADAAFPASVSLRGNDGRLRVLALEWGPPEPGGGGVRGLARDVTRERALEAELARGALRDPLTGLANRAYFRERLVQTVRMWARAPDRCFAVLLLDVDGFRLINETFGDAAGDEALVGIARRMERCVRPGDTLARFGDDAFALLLDELGDPSDAERVARRLESALDRPLPVAGEEIFVTLSVGIALPSAELSTAESLLEDAEAALRRARVPGAPKHVVFDRTMQAAIEERLLLERDLARALERGELEVDYQPVVSLGDGALWGFEALPRWRHPVRGAVPASELIPLAERTGQGVAIAFWVLREACEQGGRWQRLRPDAPLRVSVNLSGKELLRPDLAEHVHRLLERTGLEGRSLSLEIPEAVLSARAEPSGGVLRELGRLGVRIQVDGFGGGASAIRHLRELPVAGVKLDPGLAEGGGELVRAAVGMARALDLRVVALGVESRAQLERMRALECDCAQGSVVSPPLSRAAAEALLAREDPFGLAA